MKTLIVLLTCLSSVAFAKSPIDGTWKIKDKDVELFIVSGKKGKVKAIMKTNSCKPIYVKMIGAIEKVKGGLNLVLATPKPLAYPGECSLDIGIIVSLKVRKNSLKVNEGVILSIISCDEGGAKSETDSIKGRVFKRTDPRKFFPTTVVRKPLPKQIHI